MPSSFESLGSDSHRDGGGPCDCSSCLLLCCGGGGAAAAASGASGGDSIVSRRSMGPLADSLGLTTGVAMWLAVVQLPVIMGLVLHYPTVRVDLFSTSIRTVPFMLDNALASATTGGNQTGTAAAAAASASDHAIAAADASAVAVSSYDHGIGISGIYVLSAASVTFFAVLCMNLIDRSMGFAGAGGGDDYEAAYSIRNRITRTNRMMNEEFVAQNMGMMIDPTFRMWNQVPVSHPPCVIPPHSGNARHQRMHEPTCFAGIWAHDHRNTRNHLRHCVLPRAMAGDRAVHAASKRIAGGTGTATGQLQLQGSTSIPCCCCRVG